MYVSVYIEDFFSLCTGSFFFIYKCVNKKMNNISLYFNITSLKSITINLNNKYNNIESNL